MSQETCKVIFVFKKCQSLKNNTCYKFCFKIGRTAIEICDMLKLTFRKEIMNWTQIFEWLSELRSWWNYASGVCSMEKHLVTISTQMFCNIYWQWNINFFCLHQESKIFIMYLSVQEFLAINCMTVVSYSVFPHIKPCVALFCSQNSS